MGSPRLTSKSAAPDQTTLESWLGPPVWRLWLDLTTYLDQTYPKISPDWVYGGQKHGWGLRYKQGKALCTLIPERERLLVVVVLGHQERAKFEAKPWSPTLAQYYAEATTYADGKWLALDAAADLAGIRDLLALKRRPRPSAGR